MSSPFDCSLITGSESGGAEILYIGAIFCSVIGLFACIAVEIALKQFLVNTYLDPAVIKRVKQIKAAFPHIGKPDQTEEEAKEWQLANPNETYYNRITAQAAYIEGRSIDDDLVTNLAQNGCYSTVSAYCASTVRGYTLLATMLLTCGVTMTYLFIRNTMLSKEWSSGLNGLNLIGYMLCMLTAIVMTGDRSGGAVFRNANIALWSNIPYDGPWSKLLDLHSIGIVGFCLVPTLVHMLQLWFNPTFQGNAAVAWKLIICTWAGLALFGLPQLLQKLGKISSLKAGFAQCCGECVVVFAAVASFFQYEAYPTAYCAGHSSKLNWMLVGALLSAVTANIARHYAQAPTVFPTDPSLILYVNGKPSAVTGPCSALEFYGNPAKLPEVNPNYEVNKGMSLECAEEKEQPECQAF